MGLMFALQDDEPAELEPGTRLLNGLYQIVEPLQPGGFAMTYVARDSLDRHVVIKECFPAGLCERVGGVVRALSPSDEAKFVALKRQFLREAHGVATLKHPHVVAVHQVFEENNTAYMVLDYVAGMDLISLLEDEPERLTGDFLDRTLRETLKAVKHIHANGILHRDIAPDNVRVDIADRITLIDFGAASARSSELKPEPSVIPAVKDGYSPPEFYYTGQVHDFSSDLYSVGATFYHLLTGGIPPGGSTRADAVASGQADPYVPLASGDWNCGHHVLVTIDQALQLVRERRPQSADLWLQLLDELPSKRPAPAKVPVFDPALEATISTMVRDVNASLVLVLPQRLGETPLRAAKRAVAAVPDQKQWVDISGAPIIDIDSWVRQHDPARAGKSGRWASGDVLALDRENGSGMSRYGSQAASGRKSVIAAFLARCFTRNSVSYAT